MDMSSSNVHTFWSLRVPRSVNLRMDLGKVTTFAQHLSDTWLLVNICNATELGRGSGYGTFHGPPMSSQYNWK